MKKYFQMMFELTSLIILFMGAIGILVHFLYSISF